MWRRRSSQSRPSTTRRRRTSSPATSDETALEACRLCPRYCGANRLAGQTGGCGAGSLARVYRHGPHFGEEPPISGTRGSGTVFFSHCTLSCIYCQNFPWSQEAQGADLTPEALCALFRELADQGCHNWNLVSPTPWLPQIRAATAPLIRSGVRLPFVYNTSGFESATTLDAFRDLADIGLTDLRYAQESTAREASGAAHYVAAARAALKWFWNALGPLELDDAGVARRGTICRLLVLPGRAGEAVDNLRWLADTVGTDIHVSVMSQYTPVHRATVTPGWDRTLTPDEYAQVTATVAELGFENGWVQELETPGPEDLLGCAMPAGAGAVGQSHSP